MSSRDKMTLICCCVHSPNDVPREPQRNVSIAAVRGAVRPSKKNQSAEGAGGLGIIRSNKVGETE